MRIEQKADDILRAYDRNRDGYIDGRYETVRRTVHLENRAPMHPGFPGGMDFWTRVTTTYSQGKLFMTADRNRDGWVSRRELVDQIRLFDHNGNGHLESRGLAFWQPKQEAEHFEDAFGERLIRRDVEPI